MREMKSSILINLMSTTTPVTISHQPTPCHPLLLTSLPQLLQQISLREELTQRIPHPHLFIFHLPLQLPLSGTRPQFLLLLPVPHHLLLQCLLVLHLLPLLELKYSLLSINIYSYSFFIPREAVKSKNFSIPPWPEILTLEWV